MVTGAMCHDFRMLRNPEIKQQALPPASRSHGHRSMREMKSNTYVKAEFCNMFLTQNLDEYVNVAWLYMQHNGIDKIENIGKSQLL